MRELVIAGPSSLATLQRLRRGPSLHSFQPCDRLALFGDHALEPGNLTQQHCDARNGTARLATGADPPVILTFNWRCGRTIRSLRAYTVEQVARQPVMVIMGRMQRE